MNQPSADRFATCCSEAMFGYAEAAQAMWWGAALEALNICDQAVKAVMPGSVAKPTSWFNPNPNGQPHYDGMATQTSAPPLMPWMAGLSGPAGMAGWQGGAFPVLSPVEVWLNMFPLRGGPAAWPMAFFMLSAGIPKAVAWPAAEANAAMMEAAEVATAQLQTVFANYRTDSGYATAGFSDTSVTFSEMPISTLMMMSWPLSA